MPICGQTNIIIIINTRGLSQLSPWPLQHRRCLQTRQHAAWMLSSKSQEHWTGLFLDNSSWLSIPAPSPLLHYFGMLKIFPWNNARGMCPMLSNAVRKIQKTHGPDHFCVDFSFWRLTITIIDTSRLVSPPDAAWSQRYNLDHGESQPEALDQTAGIKIFSRSRCLLSGSYWGQEPSHKHMMIIYMGF